MITDLQGSGIVVEGRTKALGRKHQGWEGSEENETVYMVQKESNQVKHTFHEERRPEKNGASAMRQVEQRETRENARV